MSLEFDGVDSASGTRLRIAAGAELPSQISLMAWVKIDAMDSDRVLTNDGTLTIGFILRNTGGDLLTFRLEAGFSTTVGLWTAPASILTLDQWHHLAITYDHGSVSNDPVLYLDGISQSVTENLTPVGSRTTSTDDLLIGGFAAGSTIDGDLADVRVYNRILSVDEIATIHALRGKDSIIHGMIHGYRMNEGAVGSSASGAGSVKDRGSSEVNATPENSPAYREGILSFGRKVA